MYPCAPRVKTLLSASPVLQELVMNGNEWERWKWCRTVSSTTLQRLTIRRKDFYPYEEGIIDDDPRGLSYEFDNVSFDTPALTYLDYSDYVPKEYPTVNLDSLVEANLNLSADVEGVWRDEHANTFNPMNLIIGFKNVEILNLTIQPVEELEQMKHFLGKLSCLELVEVRAKAASSDAKLKIMADLLMLPRASTKCKVKVKFFTNTTLLRG